MADEYIDVTQQDLAPIQEGDTVLMIDASGNVRRTPYNQLEPMIAAAQERFDQYQTDLDQITADAQRGGENLLDALIGVTGMTSDDLSFTLRHQLAEIKGDPLPQWMTISGLGTTVTLSVPVSGEFNVYQDGLLITTITGSSAVITSLAEYTTYSFHMVPVVNGTENTDEKTNRATITTGEQVPYNHLFALNGDSRIHAVASTTRFFNIIESTDYSDNAHQIFARGFWATLQANMDNRIDLPRGAQFGIAAETTKEIAARAELDAATAAALGVENMIFLGGVNDNGEHEPEVSIANYQTIFSAFNNQGIRIFLINELPADTWEGYPVKHMAKVDWLSDPQREAEYDLVIIDAFHALKKEGTTCTYKEGYSEDGVHLNYLGYKALASVIESYLAPLYPLAQFPSLNRLPVTGTEGDFINRNPLLIGSTGTVAGATVVAGDVADGCRVVHLHPTNNEGLTVTPSKSVSPDGYDEQVITITGASSSVSFNGQGASFSLYEAVSAANEVSAGDQVRLFARIRVDAGMANLYCVKLNNVLRGTDIKSDVSDVYVDQAGTFSDARAAGGNEFLAFTDGEAVDIVMMTPPVTVPDNWNAPAASGQRFVSSVDIKVRGDNQPVNAVVRISQAGLIKVD